MREDPGERRRIIKYERRAVAQAASRRAERMAAAGNEDAARLWRALATWVLFGAMSPGQVAEAIIRLEEEGDHDTR